MSTCKTIKVKPWGKGQGDFVMINEADFVSGKHHLFESAPAREYDHQHDKNQRAKHKTEAVKII